MSMRETVLSPQLGTQMLPNPAASPEQGRLPTAMTAVTVLVFTSMRWTVFLGAFETHSASSVETCQSGEPSAVKTASGLMADISRRTPGVETPGRGGRRGRCCLASLFALGGGASCAQTMARVVRKRASVLVSIKFSLFGEGGDHAFGIDAPDRTFTGVRQPNRAGRGGDGSGGVAEELLRYPLLIGGGIDASERETGLGDPKKSITEGEIAGGVGNHEIDRLDDFVGLGIDALDLAFFLAENP